MMGSRFGVARSRFRLCRWPQAGMMRAGCRACPETGWPFNPAGPDQGERFFLLSLLCVLKGVRQVVMGGSACLMSVDPAEGAGLFPLSLCRGLFCREGGKFRFPRFLSCVAGQQVWPEKGGKVKRVNGPAGLLSCRFGKRFFAYPAGGSDGKNDAAR